MKINEIIKQFLLDDCALCSGGRFTGQDFLNIQSILDETLDNFVIYDNGGGKPFSIRIYANHRILVGPEEIDNYTLKKFEAFAVSDKPYTYMYKIDGKETIVKQLPKY